jgi:fumarylacetoacetate (FAA) hydrolase
LPRAYQWVSTRAPGVDAEPGLVQRCSDPLLGPCDDAPAVDPGMSLACSPALAVITGDVPKAAPPEQALDGVRLLVLVNDWSLHDGVEHETAPLQGSPGAAFGPVAVTPDELGAAWSGGQVKLPLQIRRNGRPTDPAVPDDGRAVISFGALLSRLVRARRLSAGSLVGGGAGGARMAGPLSPGDSVRIELIGPDGLSVFGAIEQHVQDTLGAG